MEQPEFEEMKGFVCEGCGYPEEHISPIDVGEEITCPACGRIQKLVIQPIAARLARGNFLAPNMAFHENFEYAGED